MSNAHMHLVRRGPSVEVVRTLLASARLPTSDLEDAHCEHFFFAGDAATPRGIVGVEIFGDVGLLRSLMVVDEARGTGLGSALVDHAERYAEMIGVRALYLLTTTAAPFFEKRGYTASARESAPAAIRSTREFSDICPASCAFMTKQIVRR